LEAEPDVTRWLSPDPAARPATATAADSDAEAVDPDPWLQEPDGPVPERVLKYARDFLRVLPSTLPEPMVARGDDGGLVFEWTGENARVLRVRLGSDGMLVYAGRLGARRRISGAEPLGDELPVLIRQAILQVAA
jgi:hypothetical protein